MDAPLMDALLMGEGWRSALLMDAPADRCGQMDGVDAPPMDARLMVMRRRSALLMDVRRMEAGKGTNGSAAGLQPVQLTVPQQDTSNSDAVATMASND